MSEKMLDKLRSYLTLEQDFTHRAFLDGMDKLGSKESRELLGIIYANYLIRGRIIQNIIKYCVAYGIPLSSFDDLLNM
jgi:hypothetical protein